MITVRALKARMKPCSGPRAAPRTSGRARGPKTSSLPRSVMLTTVAILAPRNSKARAPTAVSRMNHARTHCIRIPKATTRQGILRRSLESPQATRQKKRIPRAARASAIAASHWIGPVPCKHERTRSADPLPDERGLGEQDVAALEPAAVAVVDRRQLLADLHLVAGRAMEDEAHRGIDAVAEARAPAAEARHGDADAAHVAEAEPAGAVREPRGAAGRGRQPPGVLEASRVAVLLLDRSGERREG